MACELFKTGFCFISQCMVDIFTHRRVETELVLSNICTIVRLNTQDLRTAMKAFTWKAGKFPLYSTCHFCLAFILLKLMVFENLDTKAAVNFNWTPALHWEISNVDQWPFKFLHRNFLSLFPRFVLRSLLPWCKLSFKPKNHSRCQTTTSPGNRAWGPLLCCFVERDLMICTKVPASPCESIKNPGPNSASQAWCQLCSVLADLLSCLRFTDCHPTSLHALPEAGTRQPESLCPGLLLWELLSHTPAQPTPLTPSPLSLCSWSPSLI